MFYSPDISPGNGIIFFKSSFKSNFYFNNEPIFQKFHYDLSPGDNLLPAGGYEPEPDSSSFPLLNIYMKISFLSKICILSFSNNAI